MPGGAVLALEQCQRRIRREAFHLRYPPREEIRRQRELLDIDLPVAAAFDISAQRQNAREDRMSRPAPHHLSRLGPRVGIQQILRMWCDALACQQGPEIDHVGAQEQRICGLLRSRDGARKACGRLIDAQHQPLRFQTGQCRRALAGAAADIQNRRGAAVPGAQKAAEGRQAVGCGRFAKRVRGMFGHQVRQQVVRAGLRAGNRA